VETFNFLGKGAASPNILLTHYGKRMPFSLSEKEKKKKQKKRGKERERVTVLTFSFKFNGGSTGVTPRGPAFVKGELS